MQDERKLNREWIAGRASSGKEVRRRARWRRRAAAAVETGDEEVGEREGEWALSEELGRLAFEPRPT